MYANASETPVASALTDAAGSYVFTSAQLPDGTYRLRFADADWWSGATTWSGATPVAVHAATPTTIDDALDLASGGFTGTVTDGSDPVPGIGVLVFQAGTGTVVGSATTDATGAFTVDGLFVQPYTIGFVDPDGNLRADSSGARTGTDPTAGTPYAVADGITSDLGAFVLVGRDCTPGRTYTGADLAGSNLTDCDLSYTDLENVDLAGATLTNANLTGADLLGANLDGTDLTNANLYYVASGGLVGLPLALPAIGPSWTVTSSALAHRSGERTSTQLPSTGRHLAFAYLVAAHLHGAVTDTTELSGADLSGADLSGAHLTADTLQRSHLSGADLSNATFSASDLSGADLSGANLDRTDLSGATLDYAHSGGIVGSPAGLPAQWTLVGGYLIGPARACSRGARISRRPTSSARTSRCPASWVRTSTARCSAEATSPAPISPVPICRAPISPASSSTRRSSSTPT